jgi:hypothetical protein
MKPAEESAEARSDFATEESTSVMGVDLLSSLTERSRRTDVSLPPPLPEPPEISISTEEPEPVTTMRPVEEPEPVTTMRPVEPEPVTTMRPVAPPPQLLIVDGEYPGLGDEESTVMMEEPEPTTLAVRVEPASPPEPPAPAPPKLAIVPPPAPLPPQSAPDPQWAAELKPRVLDTIRVAPLPPPILEMPPESTSQPATGSRRLSTLAALALGVAAWTLGLGHHQELQPSAVASPTASVSSALVTPSGLATAFDNVRVALGSLVHGKSSARR